jgi:hypothetical protein
LSERIRITPQQIITRNSSGKVTFNTDNFYLKTGSGTLFAGGNTRAPAIYGQNIITDHPVLGGYASGLYSSSQSIGNVQNNSTPGSLVYTTPKCSSLVYYFSENWGFAGIHFTSQTLRTVNVYDWDTNQMYSGPQFRWGIGPFNRLDSGVFYPDPYGGGSTVYGETRVMIYPIANSSLPPVSAANGVTYILNYTYSELFNASALVTTTDYYGNPVTNTAYIYQYYGLGDVRVRPHGVFITRNPVQLSLAVTP